jgi:predicted ester cyclase
MSTEDNKSIVRRFFEEGPSKGDLSVADELLAPNFALHTPLPSAPGIQGMNDVITACRAAFEHLNVTVEDMVAEDDTVAARFTARGINKGAFMGLPPKSKSITMQASRSFESKTGRLQSYGVSQLARADAAARDLAAFRRVGKIGCRASVKLRS